MNELSATFPPLESPPVHFATENNTLVTSQTGSTALVPCIIHNIGDGTVSAKMHAIWILSCFVYSFAFLLKSNVLKILLYNKCGCRDWKITRKIAFMLINGAILYEKSVYSCFRDKMENRRNLLVLCFSRGNVSCAFKIFIEYTSGEFFAKSCFLKEYRTDKKSSYKNMKKVFCVLPWNALFAFK